MSIRALIFDFGGVIVRMVNEAPRQQLASRFGVRLDTLYRLVFDSEMAQRAALGEISFERHWQTVGRLLQIPDQESEPALEAFLSADDVDHELIAWMRSLRPQYKIGLLSNAWDNLRGLLTERWKIADVFDDLLISAEVGLVKPDPRIFELAVCRLGVEPGEALFFDDTHDNVLAARLAGLQAYQYTDLAQAQQALQG